MKKRMTAILLCLTLAVSMLGTNDMTMAKKAKLKLNKKKITLYVGQTARLKVKGTKKKVKWKSSKKKIASVSKKGKVKAKKKGYCNEKASAGTDGQDAGNNQAG